MRGLVLALSLVALPVAATAQTTNCQWVGRTWTCQQAPGVNWGALQTPNVAGAYAAGVAARRAREAATPPTGQTTARWAKDGATYDDYLKDRYECLRESSQGGTVVAQVVMACFTARGYRLDPFGYAPPPGTEAAVN